MGFIFQVFLRGRSVVNISQQGRDDGSSEILCLDNQLCFALYAAAREMSKAYREKLEPLGLTYPQFLVLLVLLEKDDIPISEIGDRLLLDSGTLTPLLKRLEAAGHVKRQRGSVDEREVLIRLTKAGRDLREPMLDACKYFRRSLHMSAQEISTLRASVIELIKRLDPAKAVKVSG